MTDVKTELLAIRDVGKIVCELNDCGFDDAIELIDRLTKERDAAEAALAASNQEAWVAALLNAPNPEQAIAATPSMHDALGEIAGKNDLSGVSDTDLASAACNALHECELIARAALAATPAEDSSNALTGAALGRWCYENPNLAALTIEGLRAATPAVDVKASSRIERSKAIRKERQCSFQEAVRLERAEFLTAEIQSASSIEDLKTILLSIVNYRHSA